MIADLEPQDGAVERALGEEFPGLALRTVAVRAAGGRTPRGLRNRMRDLSDRFHGASAIALRGRPVPQAYRVFYRQVGLDPDADRTPAEQAGLDRLMRGAFRGGDRLGDALLLAVVETGVPVWGFDEAALDGPLELRAAAAGETLAADGGYAHDVPAGRLVLADGAGPVAVLFGRVSERHRARRATTAVRLAAVQVPGVPDAHVDEALWLAAEALSE